ncbi:two-component regulator propeller domain-containing protein [Chitinophaga sp. YR573]|uniref:hybrid sensor histidine kinase/response regulator transcription factor n=1 Tax=Chitinophaga sp. YR573 TaxID=1881040 RepID=UPI002101A659|nr:two-component regulator propeller domain-containing protein [Chitinophaga sp. YR573]
MCLLIISTLRSIPAPAFPYPPVTYLGIEHGLSNNSVRHIYQDHQGFMWFATYDGLDRYDGYDFKVFRNTPGDSTSLVHSIISSITEDHHHLLWIGTRQGASRFDHLLDKFTTVNWDPGDHKPVQKLRAVVRDIKSDEKNNVFIGTEGLGLVICRDGMITGTTVPLIQSGTKITSYGVHAIRIDKKNRVWVIVQDRGLGLFDPQSMQLRLVDQSAPSSGCLETDGKHVWIGELNTVYDYDTDNHSTVKLTEGTDRVESLLLDSDHKLWIGTESGNVNILDLDTKKMEYLTPGDSRFSLGGGGIRNIYEDKDHRKWIATSRSGVNIIDPQKHRFQTFTHEPGNSNSLTGNTISALNEAPDGNLWIGTDGEGVNVWDRKRNSFSFYANNPADPESLSDNFITGIKTDHAQHIWIATYRHGLNRFNSVTNRFRRYACINPVSGKENNVVFSLYEDREHQLWAGTLRTRGVYGALYRYNEKADRFDAFDTNLSDLFTLKEDRNGTLWGGNLEQLVKIDKLNKQHQYYHIGYTIRAIYEDKKGNLWIGTEGGGLILFDKTKNTVTASYTTLDGLSNNVVLNILEDDHGNLWMSTYKGLSKFSIEEKRFENYYQGDGLQSNQFYFNAATALHSGEMAFGGIKGFNLFHPDSITPVHAMPRLFLTGISVDGKSLEQYNKYISRVDDDHIVSIKVPYNEAVILLNFTALEYSAPDKIRYTYFMEGWDKNWTNTGNMRIAAYTHLSEGNYIFRAKCTNAGGLWNPEEIVLYITVLPPWYRSWWALLAYALILSGTAYLFFLYKIRQNRLKYEIRVAHVSAEKEKEMNEKKMAFFTHVSHEFRTPLTLIVNPVKEMLASARKEADPEKLNIIYRNARRLLGLVDHLLLFRKADTDGDSLKLVRLDFNSLCSDVYHCFEEQARIKKIDYHFKSPDVLPEMYVDREKMEIVLYNLLSNALRFTPEGGGIQFTVQETVNNVEVRIADSGPGIPSHAGERLFRKFYQVMGNVSSGSGFGIGLYLVKHFMESHFGTVSYESREGEGTTFLLTLRKGKEHFGNLPVYDDVAEGATLLHELVDESTAESMPETTNIDLALLVTEKQTILVIDDDDALRKYVVQVFANEFTVIQADNGTEGARLAKHYLPDIIISDITMQGMNGIELCTLIKEDTVLSHIPVILLTASTASETRLKGIQSGADDYITKPFENDLLYARVIGMLKKRNTLQQYFYNEVTLKKNEQKVSAEYREFLNNCMRIVENHLDDDNFSIKTFSAEIGMSHSSLYKKVKSVSGQSIKGFIRFIRLRKAAEIMINSEYNITEIASMVGFNDTKYFREYFYTLFGMNPSEYIRKFRKPFHNNLQLNKKIIKE